MAKTATIMDVPMGHWPPECTLVQLNPPLKRYLSTPDPDTGEPVAVFYEYLAVQRQTVMFGSSEDATYLFPSNADGGFVQEFLSPLEKRPAGLVDSVLTTMGYTVTS